MLIIKVRKGNINRALKQFKRKFRNTQVLKELRERKNYIKKSLKGEEKRMKQLED